MLPPVNRLEAWAPTNDADQMRALVLGLRQKRPNAHSVGPLLCTWRGLVAIAIGVRAERRRRLPGCLYALWRLAGYGVMTKATLVPIGRLPPIPTLSHEPGTMAVGVRDPEPFWAPGGMVQVPMDPSPLPFASMIEKTMVPEGFQFSAAQ